MMPAIDSLSRAAAFKNNVSLKRSGFDFPGFEETDWQERDFSYGIDIPGIYFQSINIRFVKCVMLVLEIKNLECQLVKPIFACIENLIRETCHHANEM
jgi:hypothetical protein